MIFLYKNSSNTKDYLAWPPMIGVRIKTKKFIKLRKLKNLIKIKKTLYLKIFWKFNFSVAKPIDSDLFERDRINKVFDGEKW